MNAVGFAIRKWQNIGSVQFQKVEKTSLVGSLFLC